MGWRGVIREFGDRLPVSPATPVITLLEGDTPLIEAPRWGERLGVRLFLKCEGMNPTGSFKDRGMALAVAKALEEGARGIICASTGNTSASAAAYAARAGIPCVVLVPAGGVARGKLSQALAYGARVLGVEGSFDRALGVVRELGVERDGWAVVNSLNPYRLWGQRTAAWEIVQELGDGPDYLALPVGNAGNITAYGQGFRESLERGEIRTRPRLLGFQAQGAAPLVLGHPVEEPRTVASAIRIGKPVNWKTALEEVQESGGRFEAVPDEEILEAYFLLASREGVFAEPASACALAGVRRLAERGFFPPGSRVVVVLTGNGLKDPETAIERAAGVETVSPDPEAVRRYLRLF